MSRSVSSLCRLVLSLSAALGLASWANAAEPILLGDINNAGGGVTEPVLLDDQLVFTYSDASSGRELWVSDGTASGTMLLADIAVGPDGSQPAQMAVIGDGVWLSADDGTHGRELWITTGTGGDTRLVELRDGSAGGEPELFTRCGEQVFFTAESDDGRELWVAALDGSGARQVADIAAGAADGVANAGAFGRYARLVALGDHCVFIADDGTHGQELWVSDGDGARMIEDFASGSDDISFVALPQASGGHVYFSSNTSGGGFEPYVADLDGVERLKDINGDGNSWPYEFYEVDGRTFFTAQPSSGDHYLYVTDGTTESTDVFDGYSAEDVRALGVVDGELYFTTAARSELWRTDGSVAGTGKLVDVVDAQQLVQFDATDLCFLGDSDHDNYCQLMRWAPGTSAPVMVHALDPDGVGVRENKTTLLGTATGTLFVLTDNGADKGVIYASGGTEANTERLLVPEVGEGSSRATDLVAVADGVLFQATPVENPGPESRLYHGTVSGGIVQVADTRPGGDGWGFVDEFVFPSVIDGKVFFGGRDGESGLEPWVLDNTTWQAHRIVDANPGSSDSFPRQFRAVGAWVLFSAKAPGASHKTLWRTAGDYSNAEVVVASGTVPKDPAESMVWNDQLYFTAEGDGGRELWVSDGTADGTMRVADINPGGGDGVPYNPSGRRYVRTEGSSLVVYHDALYFPADDGDGFALWRYDGETIAKVVDPYPAGDAQVSRLAVVDGYLYFRASDGTHGEELWISDGSAGGTQMLADVQPGAEGSEPTWLTPVGGQLFFVADDGTYGRELHVADADGAQLVADITQDDSLGPLQLAAVGTTCCFVADDGIHGYELWESRGSAASTRLVFDAKPGSTSGSVFSSQIGGEAGVWHGAVASGTLYFPASTPATGNEMWAYTPADGGVPRRITVNGIDGRDDIEAELDGDVQMLPAVFEDLLPADDHLIELRVTPGGAG